MLVRYINEYANVHMIMLHVDIINSMQKYDTIYIDNISTGLFFLFFKGDRGNDYYHKCPIPCDAYVGLYIPALNPS